MLNDNHKIGILMVGLGFLFLFLGVLLFFDSGLLAIGNILFLVGIPFIIGGRATLRFFDPRRPGKARGVACFFLGVLLVLWRWGVVGMLVECVGMVEMFGTFLPIVVTFLRGVPFIGPALSLPIVGRIVDKLAGVRDKRPPV
jgi:hypothetical protein